MTRLMPTSVAIVAALGVVRGACGAQESTVPPASAQGQGRLSEVATFGHQVTGVSVARDGRIFVNFPRWSEGAPVPVAEVMKDGSIRPYPNAEWNAWRDVRKNEVSRVAARAGGAATPRDRRRLRDWSSHGRRFSSF